VEAGLRDDAAHVRAHVALALVGWRRLSPHVRALLNELRANDASVVVQAAADLALEYGGNDAGGAPTSLTLPRWREPDPGRSRWAPARIDVQGRQRTVWFPAPGGGEIVLGVVDALDPADPGSTDVLPAIEGVLDDDTIDIHLDTF